MGLHISTTEGCSGASTCVKPAQFAVLPFWKPTVATPDIDIVYHISRTYDKCWLMKLKDVINLLDFVISLQNSVIFRNTVPG